MPYHLQWLIEDHLLASQWWGVATVEDVADWSNQMPQYLDAADHHLHHVVDTSKITDFPLNISAVTEAAHANKHPNMGWTVIYGNNNRTLKMIASLVLQFTGARMRIVDDEAHALAFLYALYPDLRELPHLPIQAQLNA